MNRKIVKSTDTLLHQRKVVVLCLDFDGCGDHLFETVEGSTVFQEFFTSDAKQENPGLSTCISGVRQALHGFLKEVTQDADVVELFSGSLRQNRKADRLGQQNNNNGYCFELYADLAEKNQWIFNKLLLADIEDEHGIKRKPPLEPGTAMGALQKDAKGLFKYAKDAFADSLLSGPVGNSKEKIILYQLSHIKKKYPEEKITFIFMDDLKENILGLKNYFNKEQHKKCLFSIDSFNLIHFDPLKFFNHYRRQQDVTISIATRLATTLIRYNAIFINGNLESDFEVNVPSISNTVAKAQMFAPSSTRPNPIEKQDLQINKMMINLFLETYFVLGYYFALLSIVALLWHALEEKQPVYDYSPY